MAFLLESKNKLKDLKELNFLTIVIPPLQSLEKHSELSYTGHIEV